MKKVAIITDSGSDISYEDEKRLGIEILPFKIAMGEESYVSRVDFDNEKFYQMLDAFDGLPTTSQITTFQFQDLYEEKAAEGYTDLVLVLINAEGSATYKNAVYAKQLFFEENPKYEGKVNIHVFDSRSYSLGYGEVVIEAAEMLKEGIELEKILTHIQEKIECNVVYFGMYTLKYAAKSGRIPSAAAFVGEALGLKPIMRICENKIATAKKAHGEKRLAPTIVEAVLKDMKPNTPYTLVYGSDKSVLATMERLMTEAVGYPPVRSFQIGAAIAINAGPRIVGVGYDRKLEE